jgi:hypothetical protein
MRRTLILAVVPALLVAGCGGSSSLSAKDLRAKANAICAGVNTTSAAAARANDYDKVLSLGEAALKKLQGLKPPGSLKAQYTAFTGALAASVPTLKLAVAAIDAKDAAKANSYSKALAVNNRQVDQAATAAGLAQCAKDS